MNRIFRKSNLHEKFIIIHRRKSHSEFNKSRILFNHKNDNLDISRIDEFQYFLESVNFIKSKKIKPHKFILSSLKYFHNFTSEFDFVIF